MRLGVFSDILYRRDAGGVSTHQAFVRFVTALPPRIEEIVLFGRVQPVPGRSHYAVPEAGVRFVELPHYPRVTAVAGQLRALGRARSVLDAELLHLDAVWMFGPHPVALALARQARRRGVPLVLGVRQDYPRYIRHRLPSPWWAWSLPVASALERSFRRLARSCPTVALGPELARAYAGGAPVLETGFSLVSEADIVDEGTAIGRDWRGERRLLTVGRIDSEKNPLLLADIVARLAEPDRWRLTVIGDGPLLEALETKLSQLGVRDRVDLAGYVPNGPELWRRYRESHAFLHVSLTEGLPQVIAEAQAAGLPVVATAVGGVPAAVDGGAAGLLVPPRDPAAAAAALERLASDEIARHALVRAGLARARADSLEAQLDRVATFLRASVRGS